jgi:hypothetical protein
VLGLCVVLDAVWLDQLPVTTHVLAWVLVAALGWGTRSALSRASSRVRMSALVVTESRRGATADP